MTRNLWRTSFVSDYTPPTGILQRQEFKRYPVEEDAENPCLSAYTQ